MQCPFCQNPETRVIDSRTIDGGQAIRRRRKCTACDGRYSTVAKPLLSVIKRSGVTEPFSREKLIQGVRRACQGRPVTNDQLQRLAVRVEHAIAAEGNATVDANAIGLAILQPLRELDQVAYLRFASVYKGFSSAEDFEREIAMMRADHPVSDETTGGR